MDIPQFAAVGSASANSAAPALLLACGNSLRQDDGVGLRIAEAAEHLFPASRLRVVAAQQFTPEMAADLAATELAIFVDACVNDEPGAIRLVTVTAHDESPETHRLDPPALLAMAQSVCGHAPARAFALTIGAGCFGYGEEISGPLRQAVPRALRLLTNLVTAFSAKA
jgi:hydrogenase maturation protease